MKNKSRWLFPILQVFAGNSRSHAISLAVTAAMGTERGLEKPRAGSAASTKAMMRRRVRYGQTGLSNEQKIEMRNQGQEVG